MLTLDQVKTLETKVREALETIKKLKSDKLSLEQQLYEKEKKMHVLEGKVSGLETDQSEIEEKISETIVLLNQLDREMETEEDTVSSNVQLEPETPETASSEDTLSPKGEKDLAADISVSEETEITESSEFQSRVDATVESVQTADTEEFTLTEGPVQDKITEETEVATPGFFQDEDSFETQSDQSELQETQAEDNEAPGLDIF